MKEYHYQSKNRGASQQQGGPNYHHYGSKSAEWQHQQILKYQSQLDKEAGGGKKENSACRWVLEEATAQLHLTAKEKRKKVGEQTQLLYVLCFERFQLTCGSSLDKKQTAVSQVIESKLQVWLN